MNTDFSAAGMIGVPMVAVLVFAEQTIIRTHIAFEVRVIGTRGMNHDALNRNFSTRLVAGIFR